MSSSNLEHHRDSEQLIGQIDETLEQLFPFREEGDAQDMFYYEIESESEFELNEFGDIPLEVVERINNSCRIDAEDYDPTPNSLTDNPVELVTRYLEEHSTRNALDRFQARRIQVLEENQPGRITNSLGRFAARHTGLNQS